MDQRETGDDIVLLAAVAAILMSKEFGSDDIKFLGDFFSALGSNLLILLDYRGDEDTEHL